MPEHSSWKMSRGFALGLLEAHKVGLGFGGVGGLGFGGV